MRMSRRVVLAMLLSALSMPALAQSPNTAAVVIVVVDQTGAIVDDAKVTVDQQRDRRDPRRWCPAGDGVRRRSLRCR